MLAHDLVRSAFVLAHDAHQRQRYGDYPYIVHLFDTYNVLIYFGHDDPELLAASLLHDILEDTPTNYSQVEAATNRNVAEIVYACTDELGRNRAERKERTLQHLHVWTTRCGVSALTVKLADWIANTKESLQNDQSKIRMHAKDWGGFAEFRTRFPDPKLEPMWCWLHDVFF